MGELFFFAEYSVYYLRFLFTYTCTIIIIHVKTKLLVY